MRKIVGYILLLIVRFSLCVRYKVTVKGLDRLKEAQVNPDVGTLFLPNHVAMLIDPCLITTPIWNEYPLRPMIVEYMYYTPVIHQVMKFMNALPVPDFDVASNKLKRKRSEDALGQVVKGLKKGENFLIYPAGRLKSDDKEVIGGASGVHHVVQHTPEVNIVLVKVTGLWGSMFSRALLGKSPPLFTKLIEGIGIALKNLIFLTPKREVTVEYFLPPKDFPRNADRIEFNHWLENFYNRAEGPVGQNEDPYPGEPLKLVSYSFWKKDLPEPYDFKKRRAENGFDLSLTPKETKEKIIAQVAELSGMPKDEITPGMDLSIDIGLDSLDVGDLVAYLEDEFDVVGVPSQQITTVGRVMAIADGQVQYERQEVKEIDLSKWKAKGARKIAEIPKGKTMPEVFLNICSKMGSAPAVSDLRSGVLTYSDVKMRALLLSKYIKDLPGEHIGILLPASAGATITALACHFAGKIPTMINWTVGPRHVENVMKTGEIEVVLSSWAFLDRLSNVDLTNIDKKLYMLEDLARKISLFSKIKSLLSSKMPKFWIKWRYGINRIKEEDRAVLLFTSGTEKMPKGVPLSHKNILANERASSKAIDIYTDDVFLGILPPFHAFGFTVSAFMSLFLGIRTCFCPDPTDGKLLAQAVERWKVTLTCGAPTFLKKMLQAGNKDMLNTLRYLVTGAEKAPPQLFNKMEELGMGDRILEGYGITECSPVLTINRSNIPSKGVGQPVQGVELMVVHPETLEPLSKNSRGLILARGPNVFSGYIGTDVESPFVEVEEKMWFKTGDLGSLDELNRLSISGRQKRFVKVGGEMVSLAAIESVLHEAAKKSDWSVEDEGPTIAVCAKEHPGEKPTIKVFTRFDLDVDQVNQLVRDAGFSNLVKISEVKQLDEIPIMGIGKIHYRELESKYLA